MDVPLRNRLWSAIQLAIFDRSDSAYYGLGIDTETAVKRLWIYFFNQPSDTVPPYGLDGFRTFLRNWFFRCEWFEAYDLIEALIAEFDGEPANQLVQLANHFLEEELSAYRVVEGYVAEITTLEEIQSIEQGLADSEPLKPVRVHLEGALAKLADRKAPDHRNSIKESISAVESLCKLITGDARATLGQAVKKLRDAGVVLHPSLEQAWLKLYGYTSDANGIRHALADESVVTSADAKYMLVMCSAFVSYLVELARTSGLNLSK
jgi:hypothetical protein